MAFKDNPLYKSILDALSVSAATNTVSVTPPRTGVLIVAVENKEGEMENRKSVQKLSHLQAHKLFKWCEQNREYISSVPISTVAKRASEELAFGFDIPPNTMGAYRDDLEIPRYAPPVAAPPNTLEQVSKRLNNTDMDVAQLAGLVLKLWDDVYDANQVQSVTFLNVFVRCRNERGGRQRVH